MTHQIFDDRAAAYVGARERLKAADRVKLEHQRDVVAGRASTDPDELPAAYWSLIAEAAVLAQLARVDASVGLLAGGYLVDQQERIRKNRENFAQMAARRAAARHPHRAAADADIAANAAAIAVGMRVRITAGDWKGSDGTITATYLDNDPPVIDVRLDWTATVSAPATVTVRPSDVELDGVGFVR